jgi:hypothetical protein
MIEGKNDEKEKLEKNDSTKNEGTKYFFIHGQIEYFRGCQGRRRKIKYCNGKGIKRIEGQKVRNRLCSSCLMYLLWTWCC